MPSFDVVSELDSHEITNAVDQANREVGTRFDFKGSNAEFELKDFVVTLKAQNDFQIGQMRDMLYAKLTKRGVDIQCVEPGKVEPSGKETRQQITLKQGIDTVLAKELVKMVKESKLKVQAAIQGEQVRVTGKKRDDLQDAIALFRGAKVSLPLQYTNFRD